MRTCELQVEDLVAEDLRAPAQKVYGAHDGIAVSKFRKNWKVFVILFSLDRRGRQSSPWIALWALRMITLPRS
jgi:hypothetical protein